MLEPSMALHGVFIAIKACLSHLPAGDGGNAVAASLFALCLFPKIQTPCCPGNLQPPFLEVALLQYHV